MAWLLVIAALLTSALSAVFGMAGGLLLMGVATAVLPVSAAMVFHGATQLVSNGLRAALLRRHVHARGIALYAIGALAAFALLWQVRYVPNATVVLLVLGALPFVARLLPVAPEFPGTPGRPRAALRAPHTGSPGTSGGRWRLDPGTAGGAQRPRPPGSGGRCSGACDFARPGAAVSAGFLVGGLQLIAGVAGPLLDLFFVETALDRRQVVATKAATQVLSHGLKVAYFAPLLADGAVPQTVLAASAAAALVGTVAGGRLLDRISEGAFRSWTRRIVLAIGGIYLVRGLVGCL